MRQTLLTWLAIVLAGILASTPVSMMALFLGSQSRDLLALVMTQAVFALVSFLVAAIVVTATANRSGWRDGLRTLWQHIPGWLVFVVLSANSLVLIAELSLLLLNHLTGASRPWLEHVPVATALLSSIALAVVYGFRKINEGSAS